MPSRQGRASERRGCLQSLQSSSDAPPQRAGARRSIRTVPFEDLSRLVVRGLVEWALLKGTEESGWLLHHAVPMDEVFGDSEAEAAAFADRLDAYYRAHDMDIIRDVESATASLDVDDEAKATLSEALAAHEHGLYRASCRVLLPEIERVIREDWLGIKGVQPLTQKALLALPKHIELDDLAGELGDLARFGGLFYAFARFETLDGAGPAPNRHAATHGWAVYDSARDSLNTIICADYVFRVATALKERKRGARHPAAGLSWGASSTPPTHTVPPTSLKIPEMPKFEFIETP